MGVTVSSSHVVSAAPSSSGGGLLTHYPGSSVRSLSQETVLHKLLQCESFPQDAAFHELPQCGSFLQGAVLQEQAAPAWVPTGSQALPANLLQRELLYPWVHRSWKEPAPARGSPWGRSFLQAFTCSGMGSLPWATGGYLLHHGPPWTAGGQRASPWSLAQAAREESLLLHLEHLLPRRGVMVLN